MDSRSTSSTAPPAPPDAPSAAEPEAIAPAQLEARLRAKEQLVSALTARLEQVAEQLDRVNRTGGDRGVRVSGGGMPKELVEQQKSVLEELRGAVERWEDMQAEATLGRIEMQIGELRDLITQNMSGGGFAGSGGHGEGAGKTGFAALPDRGRSAPARSGGDSGSAPAGWEKMKAELLGLSGDESSSGADRAGPSAAEAGDSGEQGDEAPRHARADHASLLEGDVEPLDPPPAVDLETADVETLRAALLARDDYIANVAKRLRVAQSRFPLPNDWAELAAAPADLVQRLTLLVDTLEENLRLAEVEFSVERARLGRAESKLRLQQEQVEKALRRAGIKEDGQQQQPAQGDDDPKSSRWRRMLGIRKTDEGGE